MRWWMIVALGLLVLVIAGCLFGMSGDVDSAKARELVGNGATLVDVRSPEEFASGHIEGAINVPVGELAGRAAEIPKDKAVVVYCRSGARSARAKGALQEAGFKDVYDLGAMSRW